jgi:hypothetical protein
VGRGGFVSLEMGVLLGDKATGAVGLVLVEEVICAAKVFEKKATPKKNWQNAKAGRRREKKMPEGKKRRWSLVKALIPYRSLQGVAQSVGDHAS